MTEIKKRKGEKLGNRRIARIQKRAKVQFESAGLVSEGLIINLSETGIFMRSQRFLDAGSFVTIPIQLAPDKKFELKGIVVWSRIQRMDEGHEWAAIGLELTATPNEYLRFIDLAKNQLMSIPRAMEERFEVIHRTRIIEGQNVYTEYVENISRGGVYIASGRTTKIDDPIQGEIFIPGIVDPIYFIGKVAYALNPSQAEELGRAQGIGVEFFELSPRDKNRLNHYVRRLEVHRGMPNRRQMDKVPLKGSLVDVFVPELLVLVTRQEITGSLVLQREGETVLVYFKKGRPVHVEAGYQGESFLSYLLKNEKLTQTRVEEIREKSIPSEGPELEMFLIDQNWVLPADLANLSLEFGEQKIIQTFSWVDGVYEFVEGEEWTNQITPLSMRPYLMIFTGIQKMIPVQLIQAWMGLNEEISIKTNNSVLENVTIPANVRHLINWLSAPKTIGYLSLKTRMPVEEVMVLVYGLILCGWCDLE